jgi:hypothetical protein
VEVGVGEVGLNQTILQLDALLCSAFGQAQPTSMRDVDHLGWM